MNATLHVAYTNLTSVTVLVFILGFLAARLKSDVGLPEPVYQAISIYLLFGIGLKGGVALKGSSFKEIYQPALGTLALGVIIPVCAFFALKFVRTLPAVDRGAIAAHYGSTSLVTFGAVLLYLDSIKIHYEGFVPTLLTIMEVPGIIVGIFLASRHLSEKVSWKLSLKEVLLGKTILLLLGGLIVGSITGLTGYKRVTPFFVDLQSGILALFLLHLGFMAGKRLPQILSAGWRIIAFAWLFPLFAATLGIFMGKAVGLSLGGAIVLGVLCASASYIAAPAAISIALPQANSALAITSSLALTFPFNLIIGIPLYEAIAKHFF